jgi:hypothetical protein
MKRVIFAAIIIGMVGTGVAAKHFWRGKTLSPQEVAQLWGKSPRNDEQFRTGDEKKRAAMAYSILANKKDFLGKTVFDIRKQMGSPDGFYFSDVFPAYMIRRGKSEKEDSWQIVFLLNENRKVEDVIVHKNCCD